MEIMTLKQLKDAPADMFTTVFIGNRMTKEAGGRMVTPRGYKMCKVLIFGGTTEGRILAEYCSENRIPAYVSVVSEYGRELLKEDLYVRPFDRPHGCRADEGIYRGRSDRACS